MTTVFERLKNLGRSRGPAAFMAAAVAVGVVVGAAAALLVRLIEWTEHGAEWMAEATNAGAWAYVVLVPAGLFISFSINRRWGPGISGGGVTETMSALSLRSGYLPTSTIVPKLAATAATLGLGGSGGREGPSVQLGATIGSSLARYTRFGDDQIRSLVAAGAGAGIGASFNAPIAGMLFAVEVLLGNFAIRHLNAVVVASVAAAVTTRSLVGEESILSAPPHVVGHPTELLLYGVLGVVAFLTSLLFLRMIRIAEARRPLGGLPAWTRPLAAGVIIGAIGFFEPDVLGTGQEFVASILRLGSDTNELWWVLGAVALIKMITYSLTLYGDGSAGEFMPSLFIGAVTGGALALMVAPFWAFSDLNPGAFAVVGMAATFAAMARAPLTSILIVFEITGDYGLVLPLMLAASLATFLIDRIHPESVYTLPLKLHGIHLPRREDVDLLDTVDVGDVMSIGSTVLSPSMTTRHALEVLDEERHHGLPVLEGGSLVGILTLTDIRISGGPSDVVLVGQAMTSPPITVTPTMPVSAALAKMTSLEVGRMPVVSDDDPSHIEGMFRRESIVDAYHQALGSSTDRAMYRQRLQQKTLPDSTFFELTIRSRSPLIARSVRDIDWPANATLVSIRRGGSVAIPRGDSVFKAGDTLTLFGTGEAREHIAMLVEPVWGDSDG